MKKIIVGILCCIIVVFTFIIIVGILSDDSTVENENQNIATSASSEKAENERIVHEDEYIKVWYVNSFEQPEILADTCYFTLKVENKTEKEITLLPSNASADDFMINICSGIPLDIKPGKTGINTFFFTYQGFANSLSDINSIEFDAEFVDENFETVHNVTLSFEL